MEPPVLVPTPALPGARTDQKSWNMRLVRQEAQARTRTALGSHREPEETTDKDLPDWMKRDLRVVDEGFGASLFFLRSFPQ